MIGDVNLFFSMLPEDPYSAEVEIMIAGTFPIAKICKINL